MKDPIYMTKEEAIHHQNLRLKIFEMLINKTYVSVPPSLSSLKREADEIYEWVTFQDKKD